MTDEEIKQLSDLKEDRKTLKGIFNESKNMDRTYGDIRPSSKYKWIDRLINRDAHMHIDNDTFKIEGEMESINLSIKKFHNEIVETKIRQIQSKVCELIKNEVGILHEEISTALKNYKGEVVENYIKDQIEI